MERPGPQMGPEGEPIILSPVLEIESQNGKLELDWTNTRIRTFSDPQYNHIEVRQDGHLLAIQGHQELVDTLFTGGYAYSYDPIPDDNTMEWFVKITMGDLDSLIIDDLGDTST